MQTVKQCLYNINVQTRINIEYVPLINLFSKLQKANKITVQETLTINHFIAKGFIVFDNINVIIKVRNKNVLY